MKRTKEATGVINANELYTLQTVMDILGLGYKAYTVMRRQGLPIIRQGTRKYVSGRQLIEFMEGKAHVEKQGQRDSHEGPTAPAASME
ncbi:MAG: hypothetical protein JNL96_06380 [Planctomycetaceae bacterium]|nr:hypothetical protein [Planctomycetaceae bacterium]